ncbi:MAG: DUF547 domain-containing protein [Pacificimonas sp.]
MSPASSATAQIESAFIPDARTWERWTASGAGLEMDYGVWNRFLGRYLTTARDGGTRVDYAAVTSADRSALTRFVNGLEAAKPTAMTRAQQKAYWINLYNAATIELVLKHYPVSTIRKIHGGLLRTGPWRKDVLTVDGVEMSLSDIEHRILRPIFNDPRGHYALNCASVGCPDLAKTAYDPAKLDAQLDAAARAFINHPRAFRVEKDGDLTVSSIFGWYRDDFGGKAGVFRHAAPFAAPKLRAVLQGRTDWDDTDYDWDLNDAE